MPKIDTTALHRWRIARRITLGAIVIAGTMATAAAVTQRVAEHPCGGHARVNTYSYSGIGVELHQEGDQFVVSRVFPNTPAHGKLKRGAILLSVDGEQPEDMAGWTELIRGEQGSSVEIEVAYPCTGEGAGHHTVTLERELIELDQRHWR